MLELELQAEPELCMRDGIEFRHFPIEDWGVPKAAEPMRELLSDLCSHLEQGRAVAIHCRAGIGRTGLVAGSLLHLLGVPSSDIFHLLSRSRGVSMPATIAQAEWVAKFCRTHAVG
jgi:protein-tyrosine phosphatase